MDKKEWLKGICFGIMFILFILQFTGDFDFTISVSRRALAATFITLCPFFYFLSLIKKGVKNNGFN